MAYQTVVLGQSPTRYFKLNGVVTDSQGGLDMVNRGTWDGTRGIVLNGTSQDAYLLNGPTQVAWASNKLSMSFWVKPTSWSGVRVLYESSTDWSVGTQVSFICYGDGAGGFVVGMRSAAGSYDTKTYAQPTTGTYTHLCVVYDRTVTGSGRITLYVNGSAATPTATSITDTNTANFTTNYLYWGARGATTYWLAMTMQDLAIWDGTLLSSGQVSAQYAEGRPTAEPGGAVGARRRPSGLYIR